MNNSNVTLSEAKSPYEILHFVQDDPGLKPSLRGEK